MILYNYMHGVYVNGTVNEIICITGKKKILTEIRQ